MADDVQLPDLEVIARYSLAVRAATAPRAEVIEALEADLAWLTAARPARTRAAAPATAAPATAARATAAPATAARATAAPRRRRAPRPAAE